MIRRPPRSTLSPYITLFRYPLRHHHAAPRLSVPPHRRQRRAADRDHRRFRSEEHTSELHSRLHLVCRLLLEKKKLLQHPLGLTNRPLYATLTLSPCLASYLH